MSKKTTNGDVIAAVIGTALMGLAFGLMFGSAI